jgi:hypothetical protein
MYSLVREKIANITEHEVLVLDFDGIRVIDSSFIDELIVRLIGDSWTSAPVFYVKLKNISNIAEINIDSVFKSFSHYNKKRIAIITDDIRLNNSFYIGALSDREKEIIEFLRVNRSVSTGDIAIFVRQKNEEVLPDIDSLFSLRLLRKIGENLSSV